MCNLRIAFAGDRDISVWVLEFVLSQNVKPLALLVCEASRASHANQLITLCQFLEPSKILTGQQFRQPESIELLRQLDLDYIIGVHFPYIVPEEVLSIPRIGVLNLHPSYLPYNRGWHPASWPLLEETTAGATLHLMDTGVDTGDVIDQKRLNISPGDTADILYKHLKRLELQLFQEAWPKLVSGSYQRQAQNPADGTTHKRRELFTKHIQQIDLNESVKAGDLVRRLRALTTNYIEEAAYYEVDGKRYRIQVVIHEETDLA